MDSSFCLELFNWSAVNVAGVTPDNALVAVSIIALIEDIFCKFA
jgi:hypothetical protein